MTSASVALGLVPPPQDFKISHFSLIVQVLRYISPWNYGLRKKCKTKQQDVHQSAHRFWSSCNLTSFPNIKHQPEHRSVFSGVTAEPEHLGHTRRIILSKNVSFCEEQKFDGTCHVFSCLLFDSLFVSHNHRKRCVHSSSCMQTEKKCIESVKILKHISLQIIQLPAIWIWTNQRSQHVGVSTNQKFPWGGDQLLQINWQRGFICWCFFVFCIFFFFAVVKFCFSPNHYLQLASSHVVNCKKLQFLLRRNRPPNNRQIFEKHFFSIQLRPMSLRWAN